MITYPINTTETAGRWYLHDSTTGETSKMSSGSGNWPNADGTEINGLPAHLIPLLSVTEDKPADLDERLVRLEGETPAPDLEANELRTSWSIKPRSKEERRDVVRNIEGIEFGKHFDQSTILQELILVVGAMLRKDKNLNVPAPLQATADKIQNRSQKIYKNRLKFAQMEADIEDNKTPVLDQEFEAPDAE